MSTDLFGFEHADPRGFGGVESNSGGSDEWLTPRYITDALGPFDLDPCSPGERRPWDTAAKHYGIEDDGLRQEWHGRVWLNPPYSKTGAWMARLADHGQGTALLFARTETRLWHEHIWPRATALLFIKGRIRFCHLNGKPADAAAAPSVLIAYGWQDSFSLQVADIPGAFVRLGGRRLRVIR